MNLNYLDFEQPISELQEKIEELRLVGSDTELNISDEIAKLEQKSRDLTKSVFSSLTDWQIVQLARHSLRPHTSNYLKLIFTEFEELHGDRHFSDGPAIIGGIAKLDGRPVVVLGHEKGRKTADKVKHNFGMARPEEFRKALRLMKLAEQFKLPLITFIDTPGAYPGIEAEERNQSEAIARNLLEMSKLATPIVCVVIGEGCSGGALAIGVGDRILMLEFSMYATISPEGCASILWKNPDKKIDAAETMALTARRLKELGLIDDIISEPLGGAHRDLEATADSLKKNLIYQLDTLSELSTQELLNQRYQRLLNYE